MNEVIVVSHIDVLYLLLTLINILAFLVPFFMLLLSDLPICLFTRLIVYLSVYRRSRVWFLPVTDEGS